MGRSSLPRYINVMFESHKKVLWCIAILSLSFLIPKHAFAHMIGELAGLFFLCPILIPFSNIFKLIIIKLITPHKEDKSFGKTLLGITLIELLLFFICYFIILQIQYALYHIDTALRDQLTEMFWVFSVIIIYWVFSIIPNFFYVKERNLQLKETIVVPKKIIYASMLAFITPATLMLLYPY